MNQNLLIKPIAITTNHNPGIYFGLPDTQYHADEALGSTDMVTLSFSAPDWWFQSKHNPLRPKRKVTDAMTYGNAVHKIVLEGEAEFKKIYAPKFFKWNTKEGAIEKSKFGLNGKTPLDEEDYKRAIQTGLIIRNNPVLAEVFDGGLGNEVSIFWVGENGIRKKARFDRLKQYASIDLKNVSNERKISFPRACVRKIDEYHLHVQAEHYREARMQMAELLKQGAVFGSHNPDMLAKVAYARQWAWIWIFIQSTGAPLTWSRKISYKASATTDDGIVVDSEYINQIYYLGRARIDAAERNYLAYREQYGLDTPWLLTEPIEELHDVDMPNWFGRDDPQ